MVESKKQKPKSPSKKQATIQRLKAERAELRQYTRGQYPKIARLAGVSTNVIRRYLTGVITHSKAAPYIERIAKENKLRVEKNLNDYFDQDGSTNQQLNP